MPTRLPTQTSLPKRTADPLVKVEEPKLWLMTYASLALPVPRFGVKHMRDQNLRGDVDDLGKSELRQ